MSRQPRVHGVKAGDITIPIESVEGLGKGGEQGKGHDGALLYQKGPVDIPGPETFL